MPSLNMADSNISTVASKLEFSGELLCPSELFKARSRSHKIPVRGQKDFLPNDSEQQRERLQQSLDEHWSLLSEERVERLGNLVKAVWIPTEKIMELQSPAGKFWQTMGFSDHGKQCLLPEEALYLMECGSLHVLYRDLPLSIQEGYERFLSPDTVFGHLKRLGYVVNRFDPSSVPSQYERRLNLPKSRDRQDKQHLKRKRSQSPTFRHSEAQGQSPAERTTGEGETEVKTQDPHSPLQADQRAALSPSEPEWRLSQEEPMDSGPSDRSVPGRSWWVEGDEDPQTGLMPSPAPRWDFRSILFPDLGSRSRPPGRLASPDPGLLPAGLAVGGCDVAPWLQRLNLRQDRLSRTERERQRERDRYRRNVNDDREVRRCRNWAEYQELLERRRREGRRDRPAHLWEGTVTPLTQPGQCSSHGDVLEKIGVIKSSRLLDGASRLKGSGDWRICFNVYQPDTVAEFKKSSPGKPYTRMCVCSFDGPVPDLEVMKRLTFQSGDISVTFAVVDHGDVSFYCFKDFQLPVDVAH